MSSNATPLPWNRSVNACRCPRAKGDVDVDGNVDLTDYPLWGACITGPDAESIDPGCQVFDFDDNDTVDLGRFLWLA